MSTAPATLSLDVNPNPNSISDWTIVRRRRRRRRLGITSSNYHSSLLLQTLAPSVPSSWTPSDPIVDPARSTNLLKIMQSTIDRLERSRFYSRFLSSLTSAEVKSGVSRLKVSASCRINLVVYGIGSIESGPSPRLQLALAVLLRRQLGADVASAELFDPVLSATECRIAKELGFKIIQVNEQGRRKVTPESPTLFFMPHCEAVLYNSLLEANWQLSNLNRMAVIGNSFTEYARFVALSGKCNGGSISIEMVAMRLLRARKFVKEIQIEGNCRDGMLESNGEDGIFDAFHDISWHFFKVGDETQLDLLN